MPESKPINITLIQTWPCDLKIPNYIMHLGCQNGSYPIDNKLKAVKCSHSQKHRSNTTYVFGPHYG